MIEKQLLLANENRQKVRLHIRENEYSGEIADIDDTGVLLRDVREYYGQDVVIYYAIDLAFIEAVEVKSSTTNNAGG
jgi:hypothetical protein